jgi:hypothetical protein
VTDIFQEVDEDVRRERAEKFVKTYGKYIAAGVVLIVLAAAGFVQWQKHRHEQAQAAGARFQSAAALAAQDGKAEDAAIAFAKLAEDAGAGYAMLARLREAGVRVQGGDLAAGLALYDKVAADGATPQLFRDLAALSAALHVLDKGAPADAEKRAEPLTGAANAFRYSAREVLALAALKAGDAEKARDRLTQLAGDETAPAGIRRRAGDLLSTLGRKG